MLYLRFQRTNRFVFSIPASNFMGASLRSRLPKMGKVVKVTGKVSAAAVATTPVEETKEYVPSFFYQANLFVILMLRGMREFSFSC